MDVIGVIPARFGSSRFQGKVLADILGKPMIQHVWERSKQAKLLDDLVIACDDEKVAQTAEGFGAKVVFTAKAHSCGTDRIAEVINPIDVNIVINIQGDEPLVHPAMIDNVASELLGNKDVYMVTLMKKIESADEASSPNVVKVITDKDGFAIYFSRSAIPYHRSESADEPAPVYYKHIGLYGYTKDFIFTYKNIPKSKLELAEKLEQLRVLEHGLRIKVLETRFDTVGVDRFEDIAKVEQLLREGL